MYSLNKETGELNCGNNISGSHIALLRQKMIKSYAERGMKAYARLILILRNFMEWHKTEGEKGADFTDQIYINADGILYTSKRFDKQLLALQLPAGPPKDAPWPMFQQNRRNSGNAYDEESQSSKDQPILKWS